MAYSNSTDDHLYSVEIDLHSFFVARHYYMPSSEIQKRLYIPAEFGSFNTEL